MMTFSEAYRGKKVLVTGLTGFKGQWLGRWLKQLGAQVSGFGLEPLPDIHGHPPQLDQACEVAIFDICDARAVREFVFQQKPEVVFHLAAQPLVRQSFADPIETFATNVMGTVHVLDAARRVGSVAALVNVTSDKCYENREWHWPYRESEPMGGYDPYSASKGCSELVTAAFRRSYSQASGVAIASGRAGNVIGGGDWSADRLVPDIVRAIFARQPIVLRNPTCIRPWQHALDAISGYLQLGAALLENADRFATAWNFGPSDADAVPVRELSQAIVERWGEGTIVEMANANGPHEAKLLKLDSSQALNELGWRPMLNMQERIEWTVDAYRSYQSTSDRSPDEVMEQQIATYQERWTQWKCHDRCSLPESPVASAPRLRAA
ncbi:MAG: CDP-glucose 4,6-dehydratase [Pirellulaceae bacterium]